MSKQELEAIFHCVYATNYYLVIVTKYRRRVLTKPILDRFDELARREFAAEVRAVYRKPVLWNWSDCVISCVGAPLAVLKQYIKRARSGRSERQFPSPQKRWTEPTLEQSKVDYAKR